METTRKSFVAFAAATTGRNCVATADVIFQIFDSSKALNKGKGR